MGLTVRGARDRLGGWEKSNRANWFSGAGQEARGLRFQQSIGLCFCESSGQNERGAASGDKAMSATHKNAVDLREEKSVHLWWMATGVLLVSLVVTALVSFNQYRQAQETAARNFDISCRQIELKVEDRLAAHEQILRSAAGFFADTDGVTRAEWREFAERQKVNQKLPGIQGIGYAQIVPREQLAERTQKIRDEGFPDFRVWPEGDRDLYSSIIFLEPFSGRNLRAFGYDMLTEPVRRAALEHARDNDEATLTGRVTLVQETGQDVQVGTLIYVPVYRMGAPHATEAERRAAIQGWVYSPYRMNDLMQGILGRPDLSGSGRVHLKVFDGETPSSESLLYDSQRDEKDNPSGAALMTRQIAFEASGRKWLLNFSQSVTADYKVAWLVLGGGTVLSLLLSGLVYSLSRINSQAKKLALRLVAQLSESEARWRFAIEGAGDGLWDWDVPSGTFFFSHRWKEMLGYSDEEIGSGLDEWEKRVHPDDLVRVKSDIQDHFDGKTSIYLSEFRFRCKDGGWLWILARGVVLSRDSGGKPLRVIGTHSDISKEKEAEQALTNVRERVETFFEVAIDFFFIADKGGRFVRVSRAWEEFLGHNHGHLEGALVRDFVHPEEVATMEAAFAELQENRPVTGFAQRCRSASGEWRQIEWRVKLVQGFVFASGRDVTEAMATQAALERALEGERQTLKIKSRLIAMASHEFRTPLATIQLGAELLKSYGDRLAPETVRQNLENITEMTSYMTNVVADVLDLHSSSTAFEKESLSGKELADFLRRIFEKRGPKDGRDNPVALEWDGAPLSVRVIPELLQRAMNNLLDNAFKYSPSGGRVVIRIVREEKTAAIHIEDRGIGVEAEEAPFLLDAFFRGANTTGIPGTGLGLSIAADAMHRMGGNVGHAARADGGSVFTLRLPLSEEA